MCVQNHSYQKWNLDIWTLNYSFILALFSHGIKNRPFLRQDPFSCNIINTKLIIMNMSFPYQHKVPKISDKTHTYGSIQQAGQLSAGTIFGAPFMAQVACSSENDNGGERRNIKIKRKMLDNVQRVYKLLSTGHIHNFLDQLCINQQTIRNPDNDESLLKTLFYMRTITKLESTPRYVKMWLRSNSSPYSAPYIIERFNSFGDQFFHKIATHLQMIHNCFISMTPPTPQANSNRNSISNLTRISMTQSTIESLKGKAYFMKILPDEYHFSNQLIELLGETVEAFTLECVKYKIIMEDFFTSENYRALLQNNIMFQSLYINYLKGEVSMKDMLNASQIHFISSLRAKNQKLLKVRVKGFMPAPFIFCMLVEQVISEEPLMLKIKSASQNSKIQFDKFLLKEKNEIFEKIQNIILPPSNQRGIKRCGYIPKPRRRRRKSECDYDY